MQTGDPWWQRILCAGHSVKCVTQRTDSLLTISHKVVPLDHLFSEEEIEAQSLNSFLMVTQPVDAGPRMWLGLPNLNFYQLCSPAQRALSNLPLGCFAGQLVLYKCSKWKALSRVVSHRPRVSLFFHSYGFTSDKICLGPTVWLWFLVWVPFGYVYFCCLAEKLGGIHLAACCLLRSPLVAGTGRAIGGGWVDGFYLYILLGLAYSNTDLLLL